MFFLSSNFVVSVMDLAHENAEVDHYKHSYMNIIN